jgi:hypothetical protein
MKANRVIVVGQKVVEFGIDELAAFAKASGLKVIGSVGAVAPGMHRIALREELVGQPRFDKLCGPMYGGEGIVRYETTKAYEELSRG